MANDIVLRIRGKLFLSWQEGMVPDDILLAVSDGGRGKDKVYWPVCLDLKEQARLITALDGIATEATKREVYHS